MQKLTEWRSLYLYAVCFVCGDADSLRSRVGLPGTRIAFACVELPGGVHRQRRSGIEVVPVMRLVWPRADRVFCMAGKLG